MTAILGRTGNLVGFTTGRGTTPWNTEMEAALRKMDAMLASTVVAITNTLPGSANEGDLYLVGTSPTDVAAGWANRIARWRGSPAGWEAYPPLEGWIVTIAGEATNKVRRYNGTAWVALAVDSGAEPYAGVPAQTSFWRSTAAGVRAWVQLVAADITDLATTLASYLTKADPTFTGALKQGATTRVTAGGDAWFESMQATNLLGAGDRPIAADLTGTIQPKTPAQFRSMISALSAALKGAANGVAELGADAKVPIAQIPDAALLSLGETSATAYRGDRGKTAYNHSQATGNPHGTTAADVGAAKAPSKQDVSASTTIGSIDATAVKVTATDVILTLSGGVDGQGWDVINPTTATGIAIPSGATLWKSIGFDVGPKTISLGGGRPIRVTRIDANTWTMLGSQ